jgi:hypothetical protein
MEIHMNNSTQSAPIQFGEPFHCWECGSLDQGGIYLIINHSPLEVYTDHIYYMRLSCGHNNRCVRLGDAVVPLQPLDGPVAENLVHVREGLEDLIRRVPSEQQNQEPISKIVYLLLAGRISPQMAINQLHRLMEASTPIAVQIPERIKHK